MEFGEIGEIIFCQLMTKSVEGAGLVIIHFGSDEVRTSYKLMPQLSIFIT